MDSGEQASQDEAASQQRLQRLQAAHLALQGGDCQQAAEAIEVQIAKVKKEIELASVEDTTKHANRKLFNQSVQHAEACEAKLSSMDKEIQSQQARL
eukprot:1379512-Alexandrium_andersonii.AAC.1